MNREAKAWLVDVNAALDSEIFSLVSSRRFWLLSDLAGDFQAEALRLAEYAFNRVSEILPELDFTPPDGHWPLIVCCDQDDLIRYLDLLRCQDDDTPSMIPGGVFFPYPTPHFLLPYIGTSPLDGTLAHELVHAACRGRDLPRWAEEGLAMNIESAMNHRRHVFAEDPHVLSDLRTRLANHDDAPSLLRPEGFFSPVDSDLAYAVAQGLVTRLISDRPRFFAFLSEACADDDGAAALRHHYDLDLNEQLQRAFSPPKPRGIIATLLHLLFAPEERRD